MRGGAVVGEAMGWMGVGGGEIMAHKEVGAGSGQGRQRW